MTDSRPDPDALLAQVNADTARESRGKLKVFFGMAAGVGKTYAMLFEGRAKYAEGVDVVVGYAEPHARPETEMLLLGMEVMQPRLVSYRGSTLKELDLDGVLARRPELVLIDELAHTNAEPDIDTGRPSGRTRHSKRWQDVEEILAAGIDVYTSLNVQHIESLNDVVAQVTGVIVRETVPDTVFEHADEIELIDVAPDELLDRLAEGKIYAPLQAELATQSFFKKSNLTALRELAMRKAAERVGAQVQTERAGSFTRQTWPTSERLLVAITANPSSALLIRAAKRMAVSFHAPWIVAHVQTPGLRRLSDAARDRLAKHLRLAERLGAQTVILSGNDAVEELLIYARSRNVTRIIVGRTARPRLVELLLGSTVDALVRRSGGIEITIARGERYTKPEPLETRPKKPVDWQSLGGAVLVSAVCTLLAWGMRRAHFELSNVAMVYLLSVAIVAARFGQWPSVLATVLGVLLFDFCFVPPVGTFAVSDSQYIVTFGVMLGVGLLIANLTSRVREWAEESRQRERRTESLYRMVHQLAAAQGIDALGEAAAREIEDVFGCKSALILPDDARRLVVRSSRSLFFDDSDLSVAQWCFEHVQPAGRGTDTLPSSAMLYVPLSASHGVVGVLALDCDEPSQLHAPQQKHLLDAFVNQVALAIERQALSRAAREARVRAEAEQLRNSLLSSVSHDLRTPLTVITGASSGLLDGAAMSKPELAPAREMVRTIHVESQRLSRLVANLLDITKLEAGAVTLKAEPQAMEEVVGSALRRVEGALRGRTVLANVPDGLPLVSMDGVLIEQALIHLLENAATHTPEGGPVEVVVRRAVDRLEVEVLDRGPGIGSGDESKLFDKFYRGSADASRRGSGLGLAICKGIIAVHSGSVWAKNRDGGGAAFGFSLPLDAARPAAIDPVDRDDHATTQTRAN